jgi:hypothetical protein
MRADETPLKMPIENNYKNQYFKSTHDQKVEIPFINNIGKNGKLNLQFEEELL